MALSRRWQMAAQKEVAETPAEIKYPTFLMNFPFTVDNEVANNALMGDDEDYNYGIAFKQFMDLYTTIVGTGSLVYLLPSEKDLQDLPYVANLGCYLPHLETPTVIIANFKSAPRKGEESVGIKFLKSMKYKTLQCPNYWEGEADLKWLRDNIYIAGYGIRSDLKSYVWMKDTFDMKVVPIEMKDKKLYHFDCMFFPLTEDKALVSASIITDKEIKRLEKYLEIVEVPKQYIYDGWTNLVRIKEKIFYNMPPTNHSWKALDKLIEKLGFEPVGIDLDEFDKSGADLSCMVMALNEPERAEIKSKKKEDMFYEKKESIRNTIQQAMR